MDINSKNVEDFVKDLKTMAELAKDFNRTDILKRHPDLLKKAEEYFKNETFEFKVEVEGFTAKCCKMLMSITDNGNEKENLRFILQWGIFKGMADAMKILIEKDKIGLIKE